MSTTAVAAPTRSLVTRARRFARRVAMRLPRLEKQARPQTFAPPAHAGRVRVVARAELSRYHMALPRAKADWSAIHFADGSPIPFTTKPIATLPEQGYARFFRGRVVGAQGWPVSARDYLLMDAFLVHESKQYRKYANPLMLRPPRALKGDVINLAAPFAAVNYGHTMLDGLGRLGVLQLAGYDLSRADYVIIPGLHSQTVLKVVELAGFRPEQLIEAQQGSQFVCDYLVQATFPGAPRSYSAAPAHFMRSLGLGDSSAPRRRLMILRKGEKRAVENFNEISAIADEFGFELYDPRQAQFSPADFADAEIVVGAHGAALADIGFCAPGAALVEFIPSAHCHPYFGTLASSSGLRYRAIRGQSVAPDRAANIVVDPRELRDALLSLE